jgi:hypothetical protein
MEVLSSLSRWYLRVLLSNCLLHRFTYSNELNSISIDFVSFVTLLIEYYLYFTAAFRVVDLCNADQSFTCRHPSVVIKKMKLAITSRSLSKKSSIQEIANIID